MSTRKISQVAVLTALVTALGYALAGIPNVELMTLGTFAAGATVGRGGGAVVGGVGMAIYSAFNPYGVAPPPVFATQVVALAFVGFVGGATAGTLSGRRRRGARAALAVVLAGGALGGALALVYDFLTNLGTAWAMGAIGDPWPIVAGGIAFGAGHIAWNALVFAVVLPPLLAALRRREAATFALALAIVVGSDASFASETAPADTIAPDASDAASATETAPADTIATPAPPVRAPADSAVVPPPPPPLYRSPDAWSELTTFRLERSVDVESSAFGDPDDPTETLGLLTLGDHLRLSPEIRTRELSPGSTAESFGIRGTGSGRSALLRGGHVQGLAGTSGPYTHELALSELSGFRIVRGGAGALYGPSASAGAVLAVPRFPFPGGLVSRAVAEEGVDDYQRGSFQMARPLGRRGAAFLTTESRRTIGFFNGTKEVDRTFRGEVRGRLTGGLEGSLEYRRWEGDGRWGTFDPTLTLGYVTSKLGEWRAALFRPTSEGRGALLEIGLVRDRLEKLGGGQDTWTREYRVPSGTLTMDLPTVLGWDLVARGETSRWRIETEETENVDLFWRGAGALRASRRLGARGRVTATGRADAEEDRRRALHARLETEWGGERAALFAVVSRSERVPDRGAAGEANEVMNSAEVGLRGKAGPVNVRAVVYGQRIHDTRRDPTFEEVLAHVPVLDAPIGTAEFGGASLGFETDPFVPPGLSAVGTFLLRSHWTLQHSELNSTGERLPGRPRRVWTGEGYVERFFFKDELRARLRGRLTHWGDRDGLNFFGLEPLDLWMTDVLLEGRIGDAIFFYRFHDMLERADEVEPGYRFPGFSRFYGISWRFVG